MTNDTFISRHRPKTYKEVIGQAAVVKSLQQAIAEGGAQAFLFSGPSGTGKTTLARLAALQIGCSPAEIIEVPAAVQTGVEDMRSLQVLTQYHPFGGGHRAIIVDEAHRLSGNAWDALLKITEEPPKFITWFFCTTNPTKVPATIKTRCTSYQLKALPEDDLHGLLTSVCKAEGIKLAEGVATLIVRQASGSPRQVLANLSVAYGAKNRAEAASLLQAVLDTDATIELCRHLIGGGSFMKAKAILARLQDESPEGVRIVVSNYCAKAVLGAKSEDQAARLLTVLDAFSVSYNAADGQAPLLLSIGRVLFR